MYPPCQRYSPSQTTKIVKFRIKKYISFNSNKLSRTGAHQYLSPPSTRGSSIANDIGNLTYQYHNPHHLCQWQFKILQARTTNDLCPTKINQGRIPNIHDKVLKMDCRCIRQNIVRGQCSFIVYPLIRFAYKKENVNLTQLRSMAVEQPYTQNQSLPLSFLCSML